MKAEKKWQVHEISAEGSLHLLRAVATAAGLIGMAGLIALLADGARAEIPPAPPTTTPTTPGIPSPPPAVSRPGFQGGGRIFNNPNPFMNQTPPTGGKGSFFDDEDDEEDADLNADSTGGFVPPPAFTPRGSQASAGETPVATGKGISVGGAPPSGVIAGTKVSDLHVETESGDGSKEIITDFNYPNADILDIAKTLGKLTGKNFIFDKDVKGNISIVSNSPITVGDAWRAFLTALDMSSFALIPSGKYIRIARQRDARDKQLKTYTGEFSPDTDALITRIFPLKYISAEEVVRTFRGLMPPNIRLAAYEQTNTIIVTDTGSNISKMAKMLEILDVEGYDAGIEVIPVKYASATEISKLIDTLLPGTGGAGQPGGQPRFGGAGGRFNARRTKEGGVINTIIADERTNMLIVHANNRGADQVRELVAKLDQKVPAPTGGGKVHVVYLQFADAEQLATTLNNISQGGASRTGPPGPGGGTGVNPVAQSLFEGSIKVAADKDTNSLVVTASPADFVTVARVISRLDIQRDEVFVEVIIMEIGLDRGFNFSANVVHPSSPIPIGLTPNSDLFDFLANPLASKGAILGFKSGGTQDITIGGTTQKVPNMAALVKAIQTNSKSNVLATPQILTLDNKEATFESGEKIPVPTTTAVQGAGVATSITKENVALSIKIKPQINKASNFVKLDINTKLEDLQTKNVPTQLQGQAFSTSSRSAQTTIVVGDSDTVVLGGLIRDKIDETVSKIPLLGDIPLLGWLFSARSTSVSKSNLLIFLTPHIIRQYEKVRAIMDKKLKERDDFIEMNAGGNDPLRYKRDDLIRNLPDIKELTARRPDTSFALDEDKPAAVSVDSGDPFTGGKTLQPPAPPLAPPSTPVAPGQPPAPPTHSEGHQ